jgi:hypothetical protein
MLKTKTYEKFLFFVPILFFIGYYLFFIKNNYCIKVLGDEYGYAASLAYYAGFDWREINSLNNYYAFGYGLLLFPVFLICHSAEMAYRFLIGINILFISCSYVIAYKIVRKYMNEDKNVFYKVLISFFSVSLTSNLFFTQYIMVEVLLSFVFWIIVGIVYLENRENTTFASMLLMVFFSVLGILFHMRFVAVFFAVVLYCGIMLLYPRIQLKKLIVLSLVAAGLLLLWWGLKNNYQNNIYVNNVPENLNLSNDVDAQISRKFSNLLKPEFLLYKIEMIAGELYYAISNSYLIICLLPIFLIQNKRKIFSLNSVYYKHLFIIISYMFSIFIAVVFFEYPTGRFDILAYGRYSEYLIGPVLLWGLILVQKIELKVWTFLSALTCFFAVTFITNNVQDYTDPTPNVFINTSASYWALEKLGYIENSHYLIFKVILITSSVVFFVYKACKANTKSIAMTVIMVILTVFSIYKTSYSYINGCESWSIRWAENVSDIRDYILANNMQDDCYVYVNSFEPKVMMLQYMMYDKTIHCIEDISECKGYIISNTQEKDSLINAGKNEIYNVSNISIWE